MVLIPDDNPPLYSSSPEIDKQFLSAPVKNIVDKYQLIPEYLKVRGLVKEHLDSFDHFINIGLKKIVAANNLIRSSHDPNVYLMYKDVRVGKATAVYDGKVVDLTPNKCRLSGMTYSAPIKVDIEYIRETGGLKTKAEKKNVTIGRIPIMLRSSLCNLHGRDEDELAKFGECPLDPGGYFVVKGNEKVILIQEQLSNNRIMVDIDKKGNLFSYVTSCTTTARSRTDLVMVRDKIYLKTNQFQTQVPIMVVMRAMGMESEQELVQLVGRDPRYTSLLEPSIAECASLCIETQQQALTYLEDQMRKDKYYAASSEKGSRAMQTLQDVFIAHVPVTNKNFSAKRAYVALMLRRMLDTILKKYELDDKDYVGNKRFELSGPLISLLFEDVFKTMNKNVKDTVDKVLAKRSRSMQFDFSQHIVKDYISFRLEIAISTGNWCVGRFGMNRSGMTQVLQRLSYIAFVGCLTTVKPQFARSRKVAGPRALQPSQWGVLCPCDTPEGEGCGLDKHLALMTRITTDEEEGPLLSLLHCLGVESLDVICGEELHLMNSYLVIFNGLVLGKHRRAQHFAFELRRLRRAGKIGEFVSIFVNEKQCCVYIACDGGRVCRPLVIADKGVSRIKEFHMKELVDGIRTFDDFLREGLLEYLDVNEENNALIALTELETSEETTHIEIEPFTILGIRAGIIPFPHHNQSPRNTYQCAMGKQAMGNIAYNQVGFDKLGAGQNAIVAVMSFSGFDIEDAIVLNKSSLDFGFGRCIVMKKSSAVSQMYFNGTADRIVCPGRKAQAAVQMQALDDDGIAAPGTKVGSGDILVNKEKPMNARHIFMSAADMPDCSYGPAPLKSGGQFGETAIIDRVSLSSDNDNNLCVNIISRQTRRPEVGDKFSSRHGQKGVCGLIVQQEDLPFTDQGICPDLIMNPHGLSSRMTVGKLIELLGSKAGATSGRFYYGSAFGEAHGHADRVDEISDTLVSHGFSYMGKDFLYSGITGSPLQAYIFKGPIYYQKLKHMTAISNSHTVLNLVLTLPNCDKVADKIQARSTGPRELLTRQPTAGRSRYGGLRVGEMERDCFIAYGSCMVAYERMMISGDSCKAQVCRNCGLLGYYNKMLKSGICSVCKQCIQMSTIELPYACKLLFQEMLSMNIVPRLKLSDA